MARRRGKNRISPIDLTDTVNKLLEEYGEDVYKAMGESVKEVSDEATEKLHAVTTFAPGRHPTGAYSKDWTHEEILGDKTSRLAKNETIYSDMPHLPHLLEFGHANRGGGRTPAYPHIKQVESWAEEELVRRTTQQVEGIT